VLTEDDTLKLGQVEDETRSGRNLEFQCQIKYGLLSQTRLQPGHIQEKAPVRQIAGLLRLPDRNERG
jgi:hypothetical protein